MKQTIFLITILIFCSPVFANDGEEFISGSKEGIALSFKVISEDEKTVEVTGLAPSLQKETVTGSLTIPSMAEGYKVVAVGEKAFMETNIESLELSEGIKSVEQLAFCACIRLQRIKLPSTIENLAYYCFVGCYNLTDVYVFFEHPLHIDYYCDIFDYRVSIGHDYLGHWADGVYDRATLYVPYGTKDAFSAVNPWNHFHRITEMSPQGGINGDGQTSVPFVEDGKVWRMLYQNPEIPDICPDYEFSYFISGDTLIAGRECKKFYGYNEKNKGLTQYKLALFEEDDRVYFIRAQSEEPYVLYDFSESFQETTTVSDGVLMRLFERKTVNINGTERLCLHLNRQWDSQDENYWDWSTGWWIQGVGSILGPLNNWGFSNEGNLDYLISCEVNGETIFTTSDFMERFSDHVYVYECIQQTGFNMFSKLAESPKAAGNLCFSPLSAQLVLSMVANGADGSTLRGMNKALGTYGYPSDFLNRRYNLLTESLTTRPPFKPEQWNGYGDEDLALQQYEAAYPVCEIANSVWHRPEVSLFESFTNVLQSYYDAGFGSAEFDTPEGIALVNSWANDKTHGMIPTIFDEPLRPDIAVVLADALYFKGSWTTPFEKEKTQPGLFHLTDGSAVNIDMMSAHSEYRLSENGKFRAVTLPYGAGDFSMTLFVPFEGFTLPELTRDDWMMAMSPGSKPAHVSLTMPKFSIDGRYDLEPVMKSLGMVEAFGGSADFSRMSDIALFIDEAFQLSKIAVDEEGTEASAVSVVTMTKSGKQPDYEDFTVDRPFYFTIENRKEQCVLFVGRVTTLPGTPVTRFDGDVNSDGSTNISDIVTIINVMAGKDAHTGTDMNAPSAVKAKSDVNHDGKTDISDITAVINIMAGQK